MREVIQKITDDLNAEGIDLGSFQIYTKVAGTIREFDLFTFFYNEFIDKYELLTNPFKTNRSEILAPNWDLIIEITETYKITDVIVNSAYVNCDGELIGHIREIIHTYFPKKYALKLTLNDRNNNIGQIHWFDQDGHLVTTVNSK